MNKKKRKFFCRHCGKLFDSYYMTEICFNLDLKILQNENKINVPVYDGKDKPRNK